MVEREKPLKKKDQIAMDEEVARNLEARLQTELEEEERLSRLKEEEANIVLLESWDNTQAMIDADFLWYEKDIFVALRVQEKRSKPPTKAQKRNTMSAYLKNIAGYKHNKLKSKNLVKSSVTRTEGSSKRAGDELESDKSKKQSASLKLLGA
ncbi:hypothetical protein Tco_0456677 [Tanacetum coccineum]